jgi:hypothetical protein
MNSIEIGVGIGNLKFGMEREAVKALLGEPTEKELYSYSEEDEDLTEVWHYDEHEFSLSFDEADNWKLVMIAGSSEEQELEGEEIVGLTFDEVLSVLKKIGFNDFEEDSLEETDKVLKFDSKSLNIWFDGGIATEIQWGPLWSDDDTPIFPA